MTCSTIVVVEWSSNGRRTVVVFIA